MSYQGSGNEREKDPGQQGPPELGQQPPAPQAPSGQPSWGASSGQEPGAQQPGEPAWGVPSGQEPGGQQPPAAQAPYGQQSSWGAVSAQGQVPGGQYSPGAQAPYAQQPGDPQSSWGAGSAQQPGGQYSSGAQAAYGQQPDGQQSSWGAASGQGQPSASQQPSAPQAPYGQRSFVPQAPYGQPPAAQQPSWGAASAQGQQPYGQQPPVPQAPHGQQPAAQQPSWGAAPGQGQPQQPGSYGQPPAYGQPMPGQPGAMAGQPGFGAQPPGPRRTMPVWGWVLIGGVAGLVVIAIIIVAIFHGARDADGTGSPAPSGSPSASSTSGSSPSASPSAASFSPSLDSSSSLIGEPAIVPNPGEWVEETGTSSVTGYFLPDRSCGIVPEIGFVTGSTSDREASESYLRTLISAQDSVTPVGSPQVVTQKTSAGDIEMLQQQIDIGTDGQQGQVIMRVFSGSGEAMSLFAFCGPGYSITERMPELMSKVQFNIQPAS